MQLKRTSLVYYIVVLLFLSATSFAQTPSTTFNLKQILPTSPEAAALGKFGEIPVGSYTGTADVSIPLYSINTGGVTVPISLSYHTSGIKVEEEATNVGLGWSLEPGGSIIQIVNGKSDPETSFVNQPAYAYTMSQGAQSFYFERYPIGTFSYNCRTHSNNEQGDSQDMLNLMAQGYFQPDIYQYSFGGFSGKFYLNPQTNQPVLLDKKANITFTWSPLSITATTMDGNKYIFDVLETTYGLAMSEYIGQTYKLSKILLHTGKTITFSYQNGYYQGQVYNETFHTDLPGNKDDGHINTTDKHSDNANHYIKILKSITSDKVIINFNLDDRADLYSVDLANKAKRIASVDIIDSLSNKKIKSYNFSYDYFTSTNTIGSNSYTGSLYGKPSAYVDAQTKRLKLLSVTEVGYSPSQSPVLSIPYTFTYNQGISLPDKASFGRDYWGYYNGKDNNNTKLLPDLSFFYFSDDQDYLKMRPNLINNMAGANRAPDSTKMKAWTLSRITYPTGGYSEFDYQPHIFTNHIYPDVERVNSATKTLYTQDYNQSTDQKSVTFTLQKTETITFYAEVSRQQNTSYVFSQLQPGTITLTKTIAGSTTTIKTWQMLSTDKPTFDAQGFVSWTSPITIPYQAGAQYTLTSYLPDALGAQTTFGHCAEVDAHFTYYDPASSFNSSYGGGLRVAAVRNYDANGSLATKKTYKYINTDGTSSGIMMSPYKPLVYRIVYSTKLIPGAAPLILNYADTVWYASSESAVPYSDAAGGNIVGYSRVEETETTGDGSTNGKRVSFFNNVASNSHADVPDDPNLLNGMMRREENYANGATTPISATDYNYDEVVPGSYFAGLKIMSVYLGDDPTDCDYWGINPTVYPYVYKWRLYYYPLHSQWYALFGKTTTENFNGQNLTTTHNYTYNTLGQMSQDKMTNSRGETLFTNYTYPIDDGTPTQAETWLMQAGMYNSIIQIETLNNAVSTKRSVVTYDKINNQLAQSKIETSVNGGVLNTDYTFTNYGPYKTLRQANEKGLKPNALIWNDQYNEVIAQTMSANSADVAYTSFEINQTGNWTIGAVTRNLFGGITGNQSYPVNSGAISKSGLTAATTYAVSYWTSNSSPYTIAGTIAGYPLKGATVNGWTFYQHYVTGQTSITISGTGNIDELRLYPRGAQMITYTYDQLNGLTSLTSAKDQVSYYEYDYFRRLHNIKDQNGSILKNFCYNYAGEQTGCSVYQLYYSAAKSGTYTRNNCGTGYNGTSVTYNVPAGAYTSATSQADADLQAQNDVNTNGQAYANTNGQCLLDCTSCTDNDKKCINNICETGQKVYTSSVQQHGSLWLCTYHYHWSDGSNSSDYTETSSTSCLNVAVESVTTNSGGN